MNRKQIILIIITLDFLALTTWAVLEHGYIGIFAQIFHNAATMQLGADLLLALGMVAAWMWTDAARHGLRAWPYLLMTALFGSFGPLLYLIRRESALRPAA